MTEYDLKRVAGFYWVKPADWMGEWSIAYWDSEEKVWFFDGERSNCVGMNFIEIDEKIIKREHD